MSRVSHAETVRARTSTGTRTADDEVVLLDDLLPAGWHVESIRIWGPKKTNHGGSVAWKLRLAHRDGARIHCQPTDPSERPSGQTVVTAHRITLLYADDSREVLVEPAERVYDRADVFSALLAGAAQFSTRYQLFHPTSASA